MKQHRPIISFLFIALLISCSEQTDPFNGHWDLVPPASHVYNSLDINDSLTVTNRYDLDGHVSNPLPRIYESKGIMPVDYFGYSDSFFIKNDTLFIEKDSTTYTYVKSDINECILSHRYVNTFISITLDEDNDAIEFSKIPKASCGTNIYVGKFKYGEGNYFDRLSLTFPNSTFIQANDVPIRLSEFEKFFRYTRDVCLGREAIVYLHIDKDVSATFVDSILSNIPDSLGLDIKRIVKMSNGDIGFKNF